MMTSSSVSKHVVALVSIVVVVATQLFFIRYVSSLNMTNAYLHHKCLVNQGKNKPGSKYEKDLNSIIEGLSIDKSSFRTGYEMMGIGDDMVYVTVQCRGDSYGPKCHPCFATAQSELRKKCPRYRRGIIWYDQCLVEISNIDVISFLTKLKFLENLTMIALTKKDKKFKGIDKPTLYAAGEKTLGKKKLYGMVQCMDVLSVKACQECISYVTAHFQDCYKDKEGARVLGRTCSFRFELYPFINAKTNHNYLKF